MELELAYGEYLPLFEKYICSETPVGTVSITERELASAMLRYDDQTPAYVEHMELCPKVSALLLKHGRVFFHGTAFMWKNRAWILTAPSGTGKTTQYLLWKLLYGEEVQMINGDKPILECTDGGIAVHHSPWRGKENMGQLLSAPLGGIIILEQAAENSMVRLEKEAVFPLFRQFLFPADRDTVKAVCEIEDKMLRSVPVFRLSNCGDKASAMLCHDILEEVVK